MSCIAGIINLDGAPVDRELLERMTGAMNKRAPDACEVWCSGKVGVGHAMLRISPEQDNERQPCTLDGQVWITADARVDGQADLIRRLRSAGRQVRIGAPDVELILHAYGAFGESFLDYLIGDFAFALWDERNKKLVCARDHFGVRPFFFVKTDKLLLFASTVEALLSYPLVARQLDEEAIADFLLFGTYLEAEKSVYQNIHRLPAANRLDLAQSELNIRRYWELPRHQPIRYRDEAEYLEGFQELFTCAVTDRLRADCVATQISGGLDSTSVAAVAKASGCRIAGYVSTCNKLVPDDDEGRYASMAAEYLDIPLAYQINDDYALFERCHQPGLMTAEPSANPLIAALHDNYSRIINTGARVLMSGQGGDAVFAHSNSYPAHLLRSGRFVKLFAEVARHVHATRSLGGLGLRTAFAQAPAESWEPDIPDWLNADFARRVRIEERWEMGWRIMRSAHGTYEQLSASWVSGMFDQYEILSVPLVGRHPYYDVRLVAFMMSLPTSVKSSKSVLREAMRGRLPEAVRTRPKVGVSGDPVRIRLAREQVSVPKAARLSHAGAYVDGQGYWQFVGDYLRGKGEETTWSSSYVTNPIALNVWLAQQV